jgi:hypothetical protein
MLENVLLAILENVLLAILCTLVVLCPILILRNSLVYKSKIKAISIVAFFMDKSTKSLKPGTEHKEFMEKLTLCTTFTDKAMKIFESYKSYDGMMFDFFAWKFTALYPNLEERLVDLWVEIYGDLEDIEDETV